MSIIKKEIINLLKDIKMCLLEILTFNKKTYFVLFWWNWWFSMILYPISKEFSGIIRIFALACLLCGLTSILFRWKEKSCLIEMLTNALLIILTKILTWLMNLITNLN